MSNDRKLVHHEGFEKEEAFRNALSLCPPHMKAKHLVEIIQIICPAFLEGLFAERPCVRELRYVGLEGVDDVSYDLPYRIGQVYVSEKFNGGGYVIAGHDRTIGFAHFERELVPISV